jgi:hypothetical protein
VNTPEVITAIAAPCVLAVFGVLAIGAAKEWWSFSLAASLKFIPAAKRQPRTAVDVRVVPVIPGTVEPAAEVKPIGAARGQAS